MAIISSFAAPLIRSSFRHNVRQLAALANGSRSHSRVSVVPPRPTVPLRMGMTTPSTKSSSSPSSSSGERQSKAEVETSTERYLRDKGYRRGDRVLLFDGVCVLCNSGVDLVLRFDKFAMFKFAALQSDVGRALLSKYNAPDDLSTVVLIDQDRAHIRSEAVLRVGKYLPWYFSIPSSVALAVIPRRLRDYMYSDLLAKNRYSLFGKRDDCRLIDEANKSRFLM